MNAERCRPSRPGSFQAVAHSGTIIYLQQRNKDTGEIAGREMSIVFAKKNYYETPDLVTVSGTLTGEGLGYPNNTYSIACFQDRKDSG